MGFEKGKPRHKDAGRKKGTPNKRRTIFESLDEIITKDGRPVDVVKLFFEALMDMPPFQRVDALNNFMKFVYPQQKQLEIGNRDDQGFKIIVEEWSKK